MAELDVVHIRTKVYIPIILPFLILFCLIRDLDSLTWLSWFANIIMVIVLVSIYQYLYGHVQHPSELDKFSSWGDLPLFFGTSTYAFEAIPIVSIPPTPQNASCKFDDQLKTYNNVFDFGKNITFEYRYIINFSNINQIHYHIYSLE
jgi:hypothetical protein